MMGSLFFDSFLSASNFLGYICKNLDIPKLISNNSTTLRDISIVHA